MRSANGSASSSRKRTKISLVAHSMGGPRARAALRPAAREKIERLIMLGTPNQGSFNAVQALRGVSAS